ncbi:Regulatory protein RecX [Candidatus Hydrogenisulfobacillus filiaventi]|uniref:Regulatory protein RecX n=1 Tax=Candidatus Hydrogenisulfobacillus filiaventi TaxID=2707344 RepID=A0A6F8ZH06_9FIRM|nr:regulatory protein RecX [Bacillota bacterium]CAB1128872.1 Regulatory protein RecX [Candidatus Hydrogenisulfobacillus filiaventi]
MRSRRPTDPRVAALRWLAGRDLSAAEVRLRLLRRGVEPDAAAAVVADLEAEGLLDDRRVCRAAVEQAVRWGRYGPGALRRYLLARGIDRELADETLATVGESDWRAVAEGMRRRYDMEDPRERARCARQLQRQGFPAALVAALVTDPGPGPARPQDSDGEPEKG